MLTRPEPQAIFGGPLEGWSPVRYIYVDEAGTPANEPVTIVAGVILHADKHWHAVEKRIAEILDEFVPERYRPGFVFSAKRVWGDERLREGWPTEDRLQLLHAMMSVPRDMGLAVSLGMKRRQPDFFERIGIKEDEPFAKKFTPSKLEHCIAFGLCLAKADQYVRDYADESEVAQVTAEDLPEMKKFLALAIPLHRAKEDQVIPKEYLRPTQREQATGITIQHREPRISRIIDTVHFVGKKESPILQVADACAYGFRRYFSNQSHGDSFADSIVGMPRLIKADWAGPLSGGIFYFHQGKDPTVSKSSWLARLFGK